MFGLLLLVAFLCIMGFFLAFIHNMFADDELPVGKAITILILAGIVGIVVNVALKDGDPTEAALASSAAQFLTLAVLLKLMAYISFVRALLISAVYGVVAFLFGLFLAAMLAPTPAA